VASEPHYVRITFAQRAGDLLVRLGRTAERVEFERAAALALTERQRQMLLGRAASAASAAP
jgi:predicted RNA polymerase sigma factor